MSSDEFINAAFKGDLSTAQTMVADATEQDLKIALVNAAQEGHADVVALLVAKGADIDARLSDGYNPLTLACRGDHWDVAKVLIENGADVNVATGNGYTALIFAAGAGNLEIVERLIKNGADVHARTSVGSTALMLASRFSSVVEALIAAGTLSDRVPSSVTSPETNGTQESTIVTAELFNAMTLLNQGQPVEAAECLLVLNPGSADEQVTALKRNVAVAVANHAVGFSNKYLGQLNEQMSRNGWDSGYDLGAAQRQARELKYTTVSWLKMAAALDPANSQITELIDSYFRIHVTSLLDKERCKR